MISPTTEVKEGKISNEDSKSSLTIATRGSRKGNGWNTEINPWPGEER